MLRERVACRCAPGFYLAKPYAAGNAGLTGCTSGFFNAHNLSDDEGQVACVSPGVAMHDYTFNSTCIACPAGKVRAAAGKSSTQIEQNEHALAS